MKGLFCNGCRTGLPFDSQNGKDDEMGESSAWIHVSAGGREWDFCSRSCAREALDDDAPMAVLVDAQLQVVSEIARTIRVDCADEDSESGGPTT